MSKIYEKADSTIVWLGLPSEDRRQARVFEWVAEMAKSARANATGGRSKELVQTIWWAQYSNEKLAHRWATLLELCQVNYWTRTWIIQEFVQAGSLEVLCGTASLDWKDFEAVVTIVQSVKQAGKQPMPSYFQEFRATIPFRLTSRRTSHTSSSLADLLAEFYDSRCAERRDKVYGILGIADDFKSNFVDEEDSGDNDGATSHSYRGPLQPDYSKHILEVYFEVCSYLIQSSTERSPVRAIFLAQRALAITQADIESYQAMLMIQAPHTNLPGRLRELSSPILPDYANFVTETLPTWISISDLRKRLEKVDWSRYVGHEVRRKSRPSMGKHSVSNTSTSSSSTNSTGTQYVRSALPSDMIDNVILAATHCEDLSHLYNYDSSSHCDIPFTQIFNHVHDKRTHNNNALQRPTIIIESNEACGIAPARIGFACTEARAGDLICQVSGLDLTIIARRIGSGHELRLIGMAKMCTHEALTEQMVHPSCKKPEMGTWSGAPSCASGEQSPTTSEGGSTDEGLLVKFNPSTLWQALTGTSKPPSGNKEGWSLRFDPVSLWEVLRRT
jgi:hypothetical protein